MWWWLRQRNLIWPSWSGHRSGSPPPQPLKSQSKITPEILILSEKIHSGLGPRVIESLPPSNLFKQQAALHIWNYFLEKELWSSPKLPNLSASMEGHRLPARLPNFENQKCIFLNFEMYLLILQIVFVQFAKCICQNYNFCWTNYKMYLSKFKCINGGLQSACQTRQIWKLSEGLAEVGDPKYP